jgi:ribonuclease PH
MARSNEREKSELRPVRLERNWLDTVAGSVLVEFGRTRLLVTASVESMVPDFLKDTGQGWVTAEYGMLPGSTRERIARNRKGGRTYEIQRLIGRSLRAVVDLEAIGPYTIQIDCDVLQADGGTRTASITGAYVAMVDAFRLMMEQDMIVQWPVQEAVAAVSVGLVDGEVLLDLDYSEDSRADVDFNVVMTDSGLFVELQGTGEAALFDREDLDKMLEVAEGGIRQLFEIQKEVLG